VVIAVLDASEPIGRGDRFVRNRLPPGAICALTKTDGLSKGEVVAQLAAAGDLDLDEYFPVSGRSGAGVEALVAAVIGRLPEGPQLYPDDMITDVSDAFWVGELVREQLLAVMREEVPHSIACRVTEWEWPHIRCEILVERDSQKGIVIGRGGAILKEVGTRVREQLAPGAFVELFVRVDKDWQSRPKALERLGY
jgi:GTP-binding protein Era